MFCKIGITTDPDRKLKYWQNKHPRLVNWKVLKMCKTKAEAQALERQLAHRHRCQILPAEKDDDRAIWHIYRFES